MSDRIEEMEVRLADVEARLVVMEERSRPSQRYSLADLAAARDAIDVAQDRMGAAHSAECPQPKFSLWFQVKAFFGLVKPAAGFESSLWRGR